MKSLAGVTIAMLMSAAPALAQTAPAETDARDTMAPQDYSFAEGPQPWWEVLGVCAAVYNRPASDPVKVKAFATAAMAQVNKDRGIPLREAGALVMPYVMKGRGFETADAFVAIYGDENTIRQSCDATMTAYKAG